VQTERGIDYQESLIVLQMREVNAVDFDDMLRLLGLLLDGETCRAAKRRFQSQFKYILVDEYQDTNGVQSK
jgi:superfamily I DNA/RNA helicase